MRRTALAFVAALLLVGALAAGCREKPDKDEGFCTVVVRVSTSVTQTLTSLQLSGANSVTGETLFNETFTGGDLPTGFGPLVNASTAVRGPMDTDTMLVVFTASAYAGTTLAATGTGSVTLRKGEEIENPVYITLAPI